MNRYISSMDQLFSFFASLGPQHWLTFGLILLIAELATGTSYLLWPAAAAFITALVSWSGAVLWPTELSVFAVLVVALTALGRPLVHAWRNGGEANRLNERGAQLVGARAVVTTFADGVGAVRLNDTVWRAVSDEALAPGQHVEIAAVDGVTVSVKRVG